jgi:formamidopyrimidine-DNA glycosylase
MARHGVGKTIRRVQVRDPRTVRNVGPSHFARVLKGRQFRRPNRKGKWLIAQTDGPTVLLHFGMTGGLEWLTNRAPRHPHDRAIFEFNDGELRFHDMRKLQGIWLAEDDGAVARIIGRQGPDALDIDRRQFDERLSHRRGRLKPVLMNQRVIAGLGNLLTDEILWQARLHPARRTDQLSASERARIYRAMRRVLRESNRFGYVPGKSRWLTGSRGPRGSGLCPRHRIDLRHESIGGRTTYYCPRCQPSPRG